MKSVRIHWSFLMEGEVIRTDNGGAGEVSLDEIVSTIFSRKGGAVL